MAVTYVVYGICVILLTAGLRIIKIESRGVLRRSRYSIKKETNSIVDKVKNMEIFKKGRQQEIDKNIYEAISFLRNIIKSGDGLVGGDYVIEQLSFKEGVLQPIYLKMLGLLRVNRKIDAMEMFAKETGSVMGRELAGLLMQWDDIEPEELMEILLSHQKNMKEVWVTLQKRRDETISDLIYLPVVINVFVIFINFIYVGYFIKQQELLQMLF